MLQRKTEVFTDPDNLDLGDKFFPKTKFSKYFDNEWKCKLLKPGT